jgi:amidase
MAEDTRPLWRYTALEIVDGIRLRRFSARAVVTSVLSRIEASNRAVNAVISVQAEDALMRADALDAMFANSGVVLPLHGVPVTTKINSDQQGLPTTNGTVAYKDRIAQADHPAIANLREAGAVIVGRTNAPSFSMRWATENDLHGRTYNPWHNDHVAGGSSGGAASAVAVGLGPIAHGNDGGGSLRYPAFCCGAMGLRPSFGRIPSHPSRGMPEVAFGGQLLSVPGPIARSVGDLRAAYLAMARGTARDPWWVPVPTDLPKPRLPIKVAVCFDPTKTGIHASTRTAIQRAAGALSSAGYAIEEVEPPQFNDTVELWHALASHARASMAPLIMQHGDVGARRLHELTVSRNPFTEKRFIEALTRRTGLMRAWALFHETSPLLLCPTSNGPPFRVGDDVRDQASADEMYRLIAPMFASSALGFPSISVPTGAEDGLPLGVQLMATRFREDLLLDAAEAIERSWPMNTPVDPIDPKSH